jgi:hypothetical protein
MPTEAVTSGGTTSDAATIMQAEIALARELLGDPEPIMLLRHEGALQAVGWILGRGRAECREAGQLAHIVGIDVVFIGDGLYAVSERTATDGVDGLSQLDARCEMFDSVAAARRYCEEVSGDATREAARHAALDHAVRRWPPFRGRSAATRAVRVPFQLD